MPKRSAGLLLYQFEADRLLVLLVHPGGPFWAKRDAGAWSIPKGEIEAEETPAEAALREFEEETGTAPPSGPIIELGDAVQPSRKVVTAYAARGELDTATVKSTLCEMEWPPRSGRRLTFPEIDRAEWFSLEDARRKILPGQAVFLDRLAAALGEKP